MTLKDAQELEACSPAELLSVTLPGEKLYLCIFLVTGGISERALEDSVSQGSPRGVE